MDDLGVSPIFGNPHMNFIMEHGIVCSNHQGFKHDKCGYNHDKRGFNNDKLCLTMIHGV